MRRYLSLILLVGILMGAFFIAWQVYAQIVIVPPEPTVAIIEIEPGQWGVFCFTGCEGLITWNLVDDVYRTRFPTFQQASNWWINLPR